MVEGKEGVLCVKLFNLIYLIPPHSIQHPELLLTSYNNNPVASSVNDSDGLVVVWNTKMSDSPEFIFYSQVNKQ